MIKWLNRHFMPHEANDHQPHFLRSDNVQTLLAVLLVVQVFFFAFTFVIAPNSKQIAAVITSTLVKQTNDERGKLKEGSLVINEKLVKSAQMKANDMAARGYFAHNSPDGKDPWFFFHEANYDYQYAGENLAVNFIESSDVTEAWMNSKTHRENILNNKFTEVGIATASGRYKGKDAIFVVQHFGKPLTQVASVADITNNIANKINTANLAINKNVLGASTENQVGFWHKILSQTSSMTFAIEFAIGALALFALLLAIFIRIKIQHPIIIANGVVLVAITVGFVFINTIITQGTI